MGLGYATRHHCREAVDQKERQYRKQCEHEHAYEAARLLGAEDVQDCEDNRERYGDWFEGNFEEYRYVRTHADQREGALEHQGEPRPDAADTSHQWAQGSVEEIISAACPRHGGG